MTPPAILVEGLHQQYGDVVAVNALTLQVEPGEVLGIVGANGSGKTTTVETVAGLRRPQRGSVRVLGLDPWRDRARVRQVLGVQLQAAYLHHALSVTELIELYRSFYPHPRPTAELLSLVELEAQAATRFERLSGGQQQRLSVALALAGRPRVVLLDELTTGLDPRARRRMWAAIEGLHEETVVLVSHAMDEVDRLCDRVLVLHHGRAVALGSPGEVVAGAGADDLESAVVNLIGTELVADEDAA